MRPVVILFAVLMALGAARAEAITVREIIELSKSGLSDEVLLALIEIDRRVFPVDPETLKTLKDAGVSERVILAMVKSGRIAPPQQEPAPQPQPAQPAPDPPPAPQPQVIVIDHRDEPRVQEVAVPVPVYVPFYVTSPRRAHGDHVVPTAPFSTIGLTHGSITLPPPPRTPTSDPPYWKQWTTTQVPRGRR